jgi:hypothetical protein
MPLLRISSPYRQVKGDAPRKLFQPTFIIRQPIAAESCRRLFLFNKPNQRSPLLQTLLASGLSSLVDIGAFALRLLFVSSRVDVQGNVVSANFFNAHYREDRPSNGERWDEEETKMMGRTLEIFPRSPASLKINPRASRTRFAGRCRGITNTRNRG